LAVLAILTVTTGGGEPVAVAAGAADPLAVSAVATVRGDSVDDVVGAIRGHRWGYSLIVQEVLFAGPARAYRLETTAAGRMDRPQG